VKVEMRAMPMAVRAAARPAATPSFALPPLTAAAPAPACERRGAGDDDRSGYYRLAGGG
jgi:hypothetical protein